jgi:hypothetical protein
VLSNAVLDFGGKIPDFCSVKSREIRLYIHANAEDLASTYGFNSDAVSVRFGIGYMVACRLYSEVVVCCMYG